MADIFERDWNVVFSNCIEGSLNDGKFLMEVLNEAAKLAGANILSSAYHNFEPQGASALVLISESHLSIHTYPEKEKTARFSFHTCNLEMDGLEVVKYVGNKIGAKKYGYVREDVFEDGVKILDKKNVSFFDFASEEDYNGANSWGILTSIDLFDCDAKTIRSEEKLREYIIKLCKLIDMKRYGEPLIVDFGDNPNVSGFSMVQLIETSCVSGHFANKSNSVYIDIFSCKFYNQEKAVKFTKDFFGAKREEHNVLLRGKGIVEG